MYPKILLFGTHGQLGWELHRTLALIGHVIGLDYPNVDFGDYKSVRFIIDDIHPDLIVNAAAYTHVDKAESEPEKARAINALAVAEMARAASRLGIGMIHYSTDYVFDGSKRTAYIETDKPNPLNVYGATKFEGEEAIQNYTKLFWIFRTSWVYSNRLGGFVNKVLDWAHKDPVVRVVSDQVSSPTWCRILADATAMITGMGHKDPRGWMAGTTGLYHLSGGGGHASRFDWAKAIIENDPQPEKQVIRELVPALTSDFPAPAQRPQFSALNCDRFSNLTGLVLPNWRDSTALALK